MARTGGERRCHPRPEWVTLVGMPRTPPPPASRTAVRIARDDPHERPTVPPPFDMGAFARSNAKRSDPPDEAPVTVRPIEPMPVVAIEAVAGPIIVEQAIEDPHRDMHEAVVRRDYACAIDLAELILSLDPGNPDATACLAAARAILAGRTGG